MEVEEETRKHKQQAGEKENRKDDKKHEPPTKINPMWKGDGLFPPPRKSKKPSKTWEFGGGAGGLNIP